MNEKWDIPFSCFKSIGNLIHTHCYPNKRLQCFKQCFLSAWMLKFIFTELRDAAVTYITVIYAEGGITINTLLDFGLFPHC